jgi:hypothetical protein
MLYIRSRHRRSSGGTPNALPKAPPFPRAKRGKRDLLLSKDNALIAEPAPLLWDLPRGYTIRELGIL